MAPHTDDRPPLPVPDELSAPFWAAAADHVLAIQRCDACGTFAHPPVLSCRSCRSPGRSFHFEPVSGQGTVKTWTVLHQAFIPGFADDLPYVVAEVELEEQPRLCLLALLVGARPDGVRTGAPVEVIFDDVAPHVAIPHARLAGRS